MCGEHDDGDGGDLEKEKVISKETRLISNFNPKGFLGIVKLIHPTISETLSKNSRKLKSV